MKILILAPQPFFVERGTPIAVRAAAESLCRQGHEVDLLVLHEGEDISFPGLQLHRVRRPPGVGHVSIGFSLAKLLCGFWLAAHALALLRRRRHDVIHAVEEAVYPALIARLFYPAAVVHDVDSLMVDQIVEKWAAARHFRRPLDWIEKFAARRADMVLPVCPLIGVAIRKRAPGQRIHLLPDIALPAPSGVAPDSVTDLRRVTGRNVPLALYVGNLEHYQGVDLLVDAMSELPDDCGVVLAIVGGVFEEVLAARRAVDRRGLGKRVVFLGPAPLAHLPWLLSQADILVSPRLKGVNTPMKIYSYMAAGRAILATDIPSHTQVLTRRTAVLVSPTTTALAAGLVTLSADPVLRSRLGRAAAARARDHYGPASFDRRLSAAYADLLPLKGIATPSGGPLAKME
jgi:glycosyltransferase involved in cell wall biosynthesis